MKRILALLLILLALPMTKTQMIHYIRCLNPNYTYENLCCLSAAELRSMLPPGF